MQRLMPDEAPAADFLARMKRWSCGSGTFRMNVALSELPSFTALPGRRLATITPPASSSAPTLGYMERAYDDARRPAGAREPIVEMLIPSTLDDTLAPKGHACREPVLPACRPAIAGRKILGRRIATKSPT